MCEAVRWAEWMLCGERTGFFLITNASLFFFLEKHIFIISISVATVRAGERSVKQAQQANARTSLGRSGSGSLLSRNTGADLEDK